MKKQHFKHRAVLALIIVIAIALVITVISLVQALFDLSSDTLAVIISALESMGLIVSLFIAIQQLDDSKEIARADFLVELNSAFINTPGNLELYTALQNCRDERCAFGDSCTPDSPCAIAVDKVTVSNYLTFFETMYLLLCNGVITFEMIDDLFAYRFFLAVHSKLVQQEKLAPQPENFKNIFCLEHKWLQYREKVAHKVDAETSVYRKLPLKDLMKTDEQIKLYEQWIKEA